MDLPFYPNLIIHANVIQMFSLFTFVYAGLQIILKYHEKSSRTWLDFYVFIKVIQLRLSVQQGVHCRQGLQTKR